MNKCINLIMLILVCFFIYVDIQDFLEFFILVVTIIKSVDVLESFKLKNYEFIKANYVQESYERLFREHTVLMSYMDQTNLREQLI